MVKLQDAMMLIGPPRPTELVPSEDTRPAMLVPRPASMMISPAGHTDVDVMADPFSVMIVAVALRVMSPPPPPVQEPEVWLDEMRAPVTPLPFSTILPLASTARVAPMRAAAVTSPTIRERPVTVGTSIIRSPAILSVRLLQHGIFRSGFAACALT